jgi:hypothetical protein
MPSLGLGRLKKVFTSTRLCTILECRFTDFIIYREIMLPSSRGSTLGKTVPSYRMALEYEILSWKPFRKSLENKEDLEAFDRLMDACRSNAMAGGCACRSVLFEAALMTMMLSQAKRILALEEKLNAVRAEEAGLRVTREV